MNNYDAIIIGAGFAGAVTARKLAENGQQVLLLEQRGHIGGNAYDRLDDAGVLIHEYGPHIFHTNSKPVYDFLSRFTEWRDYEHRVVAKIGDMEMPVPFNLTSLYLAFGEEKGRRLEEMLENIYGSDRKITILDLRQNPEPEIREVAEYVYEHVFKYSTMKQWGLKPEEIDPSVTARVPVFLSRDDRYFQDRYQGIPKEGYTVLFEKMLNHPNITVRLNTAAKDVLQFDELHSTITVDGEPFEGSVVYTGALDELFDCRFGRLPYRSLKFEFETYPQEWYQSHGTVNYTVDQDYTRITEFKYFSGQKLPSTTIVKEYPKAYNGAPDIPYYAIINPKNRRLYDRYLAVSKHFQQLHLIGRLAEYQYYNMDAIVEKALALSEELQK